jgi:HD superfamily phosphohydrolase
MKIIYDIVHNYIEITDPIKIIIDTENFQRLKNIRQTTLQHLYPSANHTRYEHSLGVMHLAMQFFEKIELLLRKKIEEENGETMRLFSKDDDSQYMFSKDSKNKIDDAIAFYKHHLLYAALLHDIGHAPLSHVGENLFDKVKIIKMLTNEIKGIPLNELMGKNVSAHEVMSCYVIIRKYKALLKTISLNFDFEFMFRIICGASYSSKTTIKNIIISILNAPVIDVDRLDYLMRDNQMVGFIGPKIDIERLLRSVTIIDQKISFTQMGVSAIQRVLECCDSLYLWIFNHHIIIYVDFLYQTLFEHLANLQNKGTFYEKNLGFDFFHARLFLMPALLIVKYFRLLMRFHVP